MQQSIQQRVMAEQKLGKINYITESESIGVNDLVNHVSDVDGAVVVTLPPVAEAAGKIYTIRTTNASGGNGVDVKTAGDAIHATTEGSTSIDLSSALALDTANDFVLVYSDGFAWYVLAFNIT